MIINKLSDPFDYYNDKQFSDNDFTSFWEEVGLNLHWDKVYTKLWSGNEKKPEWFKDGLINVCNNILDKNLKERGDQTALIHECPFIGISSKITYNELFKKVCVFSSVLKSLKINKGDIVMIVMPNCFEAIVSMLACARIGAIYSNTSIFLDEYKISDKIKYLKPKLIITVNYIVCVGGLKYFLQIIKKSLLLSNYYLNNNNNNNIENNLIICDRIDIIGQDKHNEYFKNFNLTQLDLFIENSLDWSKLNENIIKNKTILFEYKLLNSSHPISISFSSGTTGEPKGFIHESGNFLCNLYYSYKNNYSLKNGKICFTTTQNGWNYGSNLIMGSLLHGCTLIIYEGDLINPKFEYFNIIEKYKVNIMISSPFTFLSILKIDPCAQIIKQYNLSSLDYISFAGESLSSSFIDFFKNKMGINIKVLYGQTECSVLLTNWTSSLAQIPYKEKSSGVPVAGVNIYIKSIINKNLINVSFNVGELVIKLPFSPLQIQKLFNDDNDDTKLNQEYLNKYPGYYNTGDLAYIDNDGYYYIVGRVKDAINLGNGKIVYNSFFEDNIQLNNKVYDNVVIPVSILKNDSSNSKQVPAAFIILNDEFKDEYNNNQIQFLNQLKYEINQSLKFNEIVNNVFIDNIIIVDELPKSASNKKLRNILTFIFENKPYKIPSIIINENVLKDIENTIKHYKTTQLL